MIQIVILLLVLVLVGFPIWALIKIVALGRQNDALAQHLAEIEMQLHALRDSSQARSSSAAAREAVAPAPAALTRAAEPPPMVLPPAAPPMAAPPPVVSSSSPPDAPVPPVIATAPPPEIPAALPAGRRPGYEPPLPARPSPAPRINWEQFTGAKLLAWIGGLLAFLGAAFFVKYSFEHDLIPPEVRVAIGYVFAVALIIGGLKVPRARYAVTAHTLCATGIVCLYAVTFACNSIYHFTFFGPAATFLLMTLITAAAFLLAVRLEAQAVAVLGMLGGFLTPILFSTGRDNPAVLFGYIALLDLGLAAVALHRRWHFLVPLGAAGTVMMQFGWAAKFLNAEKAPTAMVVCLAFCALYLATCLIARRFGSGRAATFRLRPSGDDAAGRRDEALAETNAAGRVPPFITWSAIAFPFVAFVFAFAFLGYGSVSAQPGQLFAFVLAADLCLLVLAWLDEELPKLHLFAGVAVFGLLAAWTGGRLTSELLPWALAIYLVYAALHTAFPLLLERHRPDTAPAAWSQLFPPLALLLMLLPLFKLDAVSPVFWPFVLLIDLLAIGLALLTASLAVVAIVLLLTLVATGLWVFRVPVAVESLPSLLLVVGGFAVLFFAAGVLVVRRLGDRLSGVQGKFGVFGDARAQIPAFSALLPFVLLIMMTQRLPLANPSPVFGLALLLTALALGLTYLLVRPFDRLGSFDSAPDRPAMTEGRQAGVEWLPACALLGVAALEYAWHARHFTTASATTALPWYALFYFVFALFPFVFRRRFATLTGPWAVAALAGVLQFPLVHRLVDRAWPNEFMGILPALFAVLPLASLVTLLRDPSSDGRARLNQLACFGGVALLFFTLIFPIQFERQWITLGWALEGVALLWLYQRVPHMGLRATGVVLLVGAFVRLALNPFALEYHARGGTPILNWYLYSYGLVTLCLFAGARLLRSPEPAGAPRPGSGGPPTVFGVNAPALLATLGTVLAFLLLNIEIADFFSPRGARTLTFQFSGNFARDMTYTIAWALFALALLLVSIWKHVRAGRYAALGLLGITVLKLFFHDLERLEALYRIGALFAVAVIAIAASFAYQRFLPGNERNASERS